MLIFAAVLVGGCMQVDENPQWAPQADYPAWTYDAPFYYRPTEEMQVAETVGEGIPIYYSRIEHFFIRHPGGYQLNGTPRVAVWSSADRGEHWERSGYFGVEQSHFLFQAETDGPHWIRFVGPGQGIIEVPPGNPHRIYVVDRHPPRIEMRVEPSPWYLDEQEQRVPRTYQIGEEVTLHWSVYDAYLASETIYLGTCFAKFPRNLVWSRFPKTLPASGSMKIEIPAESVDGGGLRFRMEATDKAGNVGVAMTEVLRIAGMELAIAEPVGRPVGPSDVIQQTQGTPGPRPGWPNAGAMLRGGTSVVLNWMPESAADYDTVELHFSADNGRTWRAVATGLKPGREARWTVPAVTSKICRLRLVAVATGGQQTMLAETARFTVDTVLPDTVLGPKLLEPAE